MNNRKLPPTAAQKRLAAKRSAAARERIKQAQRRRQMYIVGGSILAVLLVIGVLIVIKVATGAGSPKSGQKASSANQALVNKLANVPESVFNTVGAGKVLTTPQPLQSPPLTQDGKPEVLYIGAEFCPYCAGERWALAVALERFGDLHNLGTTTSSPSDTPPSLRTLSFHGTSYTSKYLSLTAKEVATNQVVNGRYSPLDKLSSAEQHIYSTYDRRPYVSSGGIPFLDLGGKYVLSGATYDIRKIAGLSHDQIANALSNPRSPVGQAIIGAANGLTATLCNLTGQQPGAVCSSAGVRAAAANLPAASPTSSGAASGSPAR